jgi:hypothetical protein
MTYLNTTYVSRPVATERPSAARVARRWPRAYGLLFAVGATALLWWAVARVGMALLGLG